MVRIHGALLVQNRPAEAAQFRLFVERGNVRQEEAVAFYLNSSPMEPSKASTTYFENINRNSMLTSRESYLRVIVGTIRDPEPFALMPLFKWFLDRGELCPAFRVLFRQIARSPRFNEAVQYAVSSNRALGGGANACGDAELEMLLQ
jgi:hypothetical protein